MNPNAYLQQMIAPYADEARTKWDDFTLRTHGQVDTATRAITGRLESIREAVTAAQWDEGKVKLSIEVSDVSGVFEFDGRTGEVPMGSEWMLETLNAYMVAGAATLILFVNGQYRWSSAVTTAGITTPGGVLARGLHLTGGDVLTYELSGLIAAETIRFYLQFRSRPIRSPRTNYAGQPEIIADKPNDQDDVLTRSFPYGIGQGSSIVGPDAPRHPHLPPTLPRV